MKPRNSGYINDVDELIERTSVNAVLAHYGKPTADTQSGEHRMECVFNDSCLESQYGNLTVRLDDAVNRIFCHSCHVRGNLLTLLHGLQNGCAPEGGRLRGAEFKAAVTRLREVADGSVPEQTNSGVTSTAAPKSIACPESEPKQVNCPLVRHEKEAARKIADLHNDLIADVSQMSPQAAEYVRRRHWMTPELMNKWGVGWIPGDGRSLFRKGYLVYTHRNERGEIVSYSGRDLSFEEKWRKWVSDGQSEGKRPGKHRFVKGFHKGVELYGGHAGRMKEDYVRESLDRRGVVVVEGMNEVLRMETLQVAAVGLGSNRATEAQVEKLVKFARMAGNNRIVLLPDCDEEGETAFKELLWQLNEASVDVRLGCSSRMFDGAFSKRQPEDVTDEEWQLIDDAIQRS